MLERLEKELAGSTAPLGRCLGPANDQGALSALVVDGVVSLVKGGVVCREPYEGG